MKRAFAVYFLSIFLAFFSGASAFSSGKAEFFVEPIFGYTHGQLDEILYRSNPNTQKISLLEWEKRFFTAGAKISAGFSGFGVEATFLTGIGDGFGEMRDSDWLSEAHPEMKTTFSVGDSEALENYDAEIRLKYEIGSGGNFSFFPILGVRYTFDSFSRGKDAEGWYGQSDYSSDGKMHWWYDDEAKHFPTEYYWSESKQRYVHQVLGGIDYERHTFYSFFGFSLIFRPLPGFELGATALVSPYTYTWAEDTHRNGSGANVYREIQNGIFSRFSFSLDSAFALSKRFSLTAELSALSGTTDRGELYVNGYLNTSQPSGILVWEFSGRIGLRMKIF